MKNEKIITSVIVFLVASLFLFLTFDFPENKVRDVGPAFLPKMYVYALYLLCVSLFIQGLRERRNTDQLKMNNMLLVFLSMVITVVYVFFIPYLGFYLITLVAMLALLLLTRVKNYLTLILVPAGTALFIFVFFEKMLKVPVPAGMLFS